MGFDYIATPPCSRLGPPAMFSCLARFRITRARGSEGGFSDRFASHGRRRGLVEPRGGVSAAGSGAFEAFTREKESARGEDRQALPARKLVRPPGGTIDSEH
jgi:hypothetical protein